MNREPQALFNQHFVLDGAYALNSSLAHTKRSVVYRARPLPTAPIQDYFQTDVALKLLLHGRSDQAIANVEHEAKMLNSVHSNRVVGLLDYVARKDICYLVYEFSSGGDLSQLLSRSTAPLSLARVIHLSEQLLAGLADIHRKGIVHCDIKPGNLLISESDELKISDFGLAKFTSEIEHTVHDSLGVGTFEYLAPEQLQFGKTSYSCDIYAAGVTIFELLTGHRPVETECFAAGISACLNAEYAQISEYRDDTSPELEAVIFKALSVDPSARFASADEFRVALLAAAEPLLLESETPLEDEKHEELLSAAAQMKFYTQNALIAACLGCVLALLLVLDSHPAKVDAQDKLPHVQAATPEGFSPVPATVEDGVQYSRALLSRHSQELFEPVGAVSSTHKIFEEPLVDVFSVRVERNEVTSQLLRNAFVGVLASETFAGSDGEGYIQVATLPIEDSVRVFVSFDEGETVLGIDANDQSTHQFNVNEHQVLLRFVAEGSEEKLFAVFAHSFGEDRVLLLPYRRV